MKTLVYAAAVATVLLFVSAGFDVKAQGNCPVGTKIEFEEGRGGIGTIVEIGTESPHVGWYRIVQSWNPKGEWYPPERWPVFIAGTKTRCGVKQQPTAAKTGANTKPAGNSGNTRTTGGSSAAAVPSGCPFVEPAGRVTRSSPASPALFQRVIFERAAAKINPVSVSAPKKVGLTFVQFKMSPAYKNTLSSSRFGDKRRHDGAPVGAMIYPLVTTELQCDLHGREVRRSVSEKSYSCFKNKDGEWICPGSTTKFIENVLIPVN